MSMFINMPERSRTDLEGSELSMSPDSLSMSMPEESPMNTQDTDIAMSLDTPPPSPAPEDLESYEQKLEQLKTPNLAKNFTIIHAIGSGAYGKVLEVVHHYDSRHSALKCIRLDLKDDIDEIRQEAVHLAQLKHHNVVCYKFSWIDDYCVEHIPTAEDYNANRIDSYVRARISSSELSTRSRFYFCILMELCQTNLEQVIRKGLYKQPSRAWKIFWQMVEGLHYLHANNIIHRDLKSANVFINDNDWVKIGDLGLASKISRRASINEPYTEKTDIKDLALIFSEMFGLTSMTIGKALTACELGAVPQLEKKENMQQNCLIENTNTNPSVFLRWLLNRETRPTCVQLLDYQKNLHYQVPRDHVLFEHRNASILTDAFCNKKSKTKLDNICGHSV